LWQPRGLCSGRRAAGVAQVTDVDAAFEYGVYGTSALCGRVWNTMSGLEREEMSGIRVQFDVICDECGDVDNWIGTRIGEYRWQLKFFIKAMKAEGWKIGNWTSKKTLCPECNKSRMKNEKQ
jgi:hypothetical protein